MEIVIITTIIRTKVIDESSLKRYCKKLNATNAAKISNPKRIKTETSPTMKPSIDGKSIQPYYRIELVKPR